MAAPHVAGWATLYLGLHPDATPAQVTSALLSSGTRGMINGEVGGTPDILPFVGDLAGAPSPPTSVAATGGDKSAEVSWTASSYGGSPVTGYTVTSSPGGITTTVVRGHEKSPLVASSFPSLGQMKVESSRVVYGSPVSVSPK